jgi:hypothetical protein
VTSTVLLGSITVLYSHYFALLRGQTSVVSEMKLVTLDRGCDNVLPGQGYCTLHGTVTDEDRALEER